MAEVLTCKRGRTNGSRKPVFREAGLKYRIMRVFDKIQRPSHFRPAAEIPDEEMDNAWDGLARYLHRHGISLDVCSPNISAKELYRFTVEELFEYVIAGIDAGDTMHGFVYDEFHPDPVHENTRAATEDGINYILQKTPIVWTHHFRNNNLRFNGYYPLTINEFKGIADRFKNAYDTIETDNLISNSCIIRENKCLVSGTYLLNATAGSESYRLEGRWEVVFEKEADPEDWYIIAVEIEGINF